jgi:hypothetical protein
MVVTVKRFWRGGGSPRILKERIAQDRGACLDRRPRKSGSQDNRCDFDDAMKRFLVRTAFYAGSERSAGSPPEMG